jgi:hypothetical protein
MEERIKNIEKVREAEKNFILSVEEMIHYKYIQK